MSRCFCLRLEGGFSAHHGCKTMDTLGQINLARASPSGHPFRNAYDSLIQLISNFSTGWIEIPENMPYYGTEAFKKVTLRMFLRKSFLATSTYEKAAIAIAHELSHVVLESIRHPLRKEEKAVDLTAMLLGFSWLYEIGSRTAIRISPTKSKKFCAGLPELE
jgi:hypothetical protein